MQKKIMEAGNVPVTDSDAEIMLITCTNQMQQRFDRLRRAVYEGGDRAEAKNHLHLAPRLNELAKDYIDKARATRTMIASWPVTSGQRLLQLPMCMYCLRSGQTFLNMSSFLP